MKSDIIPALAFSTLSCDEAGDFAQDPENLQAVEAREQIDAAYATTASQYDLDKLRLTFNEAFLPSAGQSIGNFSEETQKLKAEERNIQRRIKHLEVCDDTWQTFTAEKLDLDKAIACRTDVYRYFMAEEMNQANAYDCTSETIKP